MANNTLYPTSKKNALASLYQYINDNVLGTNEYLFLGNYENAVHFPCIGLVDKGAPDLPPTSFNDYLGQSAPLNAVQYGRVSQTVVEINVVDKLTTTTGSSNPSAEKNVLEIREKLHRALYYAGQLDTNNQLYFPNICLLDFDTNGHPSTGSYCWWPAEESNTWFESTYFANADDPLLKRINIAMRYRWIEIQ